MAMSLKVIVPPHPLIKHWLSILREKILQIFCTQQDMSN